MSRFITAALRLGSSKWQAYKNAELAYNAYVGRNNWQQQVQIVGSPEWQACKNSELTLHTPSIGPLNFVAPSPRPPPVNYALLNQSALDFAAQK